MQIRGHLVKREEAIFIGAILLLLLVFLWFGTIKKSPLEAPQKPFNIEEPEEQWYVRFSVKDQKATAYVESARGQRASSGSACYIGSVAVHPIKPGIDPRHPIIPFGTMIYPDEPLVVQGQEIAAFEVIDTGDVVYGRYGSTPYWFDIYWGQSNYHNVREASRFGIKTVNYHWFEPWR